MEKQKKKLGLLPKLIIAIVLGIVVGFVAQNMGSAGEIIIRLGATYNSIFGNFISFCIPLIIIGFVAPGIADLGAGAGKILAITTGIAYLSTVIAGSLAYVVDITLFPHLVDAGMFTTEAENAEETVVSSLFTIDMPAIMGVMSALLIAFILGLGMAVIKNGTLKAVMEEFGEIVSKLVASIIIPLLPFHVYGIFAKLAYAGTIVELLREGLRRGHLPALRHHRVPVFRGRHRGQEESLRPHQEHAARLHHRHRHPVLCRYHPCHRAVHQEERCLRCYR